MSVSHHRVSNVPPGIFRHEGPVVINIVESIQPLRRLELVKEGTKVSLRESGPQGPTRLVGTFVDVLFINDLCVFSGLEDGSRDVHICSCSTVVMNLS